MKVMKKQSEPSAIDTMRREMDRFFDDLVPFSWRKENGGRMIDSWSPNTDLTEDDDKFIVKMDIPGMNKDNIEVNYQDNRLIITGERKEEEEEEKKDFIRKERYHGSFYRSFTLPKAIKEDQIKAKFKEGVLTVNLPKTEISKPKTVKVE
ncbi:MAG: Hsp20/alpha crystallin family protein [Balneolaceae bacterium]